MNTDNREGWVLLKPDGYLAVPASKFLALCSDAKNIKAEWATKGHTYSLSTEPMSMMFMTDDQMTAMRVRDRLTRASEQGQSGEGCSTAGAS